MLNRLSPFALAILTLALAGCSVSQPPRPTEPVAPPAWLHPDASAATASRGWQGLDDALLLSLQDQALAANRDLAMAGLRWQQAQRLVEQSRWRAQPSLGLSSSANRALGSAGNGQGWGRSVGASVAVGYELDLWQRLAAGTAAQAAQAEALRTDIEAARVLIRMQVAQSYWTAAAAQAQLPLARQQVQDADEVVRLTTLRVAEGLLLPIEVDRAAVTLQGARTRLAGLEADRQLARHALALLLGQPLPGPDLAPARLPGQDLPTWAPEPPAQVLARRPDVQRARLGVDAALAGLQGAEAARYPGLSFNASLGTGGRELGDWLSQPLATLGASLAIPLIDWRRLDVQRDNARSDLELSALTLRDTLDKALAEVEEQLIQQRRLADQRLATALRLRDTREAERLAEERLAVGSVSRLDWLQARSARLEAEQSLLQAELSIWSQQAQIYKSLGGPLG